MAEAVMLVCDVCGRPAVETVIFRVGRRNLQKDYCQAHLTELTAGARAPRRGRRPAAQAATPAKRRDRPPGSKSKAKASSTGKKRVGRPRKAATSESSEGGG
jgi:hypothetical protein